MPNTLGHIGIQTLVTRGLLRDADIKWVWLACVVPDFPWIGQRVVRAAMPGLSPIDLRLYAIVQSSLIFCLVLSALFACFSKVPGRCFAILAGGSLLHLLLDALQTKWANGVVLFAPVRWDILNLGLFWPEDMQSLLLSGLGLVVAGWAWLRAPRLAADLRLPRGAPLVSACVMLGAYIAAPVALMPGAYEANLHFAATLDQRSQRPGKAVAFDRAGVTAVEDGVQLLAWTGERFSLTGDAPSGSGTFSLRGRFETQDTVLIADSHPHHAGLRDYASYVGLALVGLWWAVCLWKRSRARVSTPDTG